MNNDEKRITLPHLECLRCGATWVPRMEHPLTCPKCRSPYYNRARKKTLAIPPKDEESAGKEMKEALSKVN